MRNKEYCKDKIKELQTKIGNVYVRLGNLANTLNRNVLVENLSPEYYKWYSDTLDIIEKFNPDSKEDFKKTKLKIDTFFEKIQDYIDNKTTYSYEHKSKAELGKFKSYLDEQTAIFETATETAEQRNYKPIKKPYLKFELWMLKIETRNLPLSVFILYVISNFLWIILILYIYFNYIK